MKQQGFLSLSDSECECVGTFSLRKLSHSLPKDKDRSGES